MGVGAAEDGQTGQRRSSSFLEIASLRNSTISLLGDAADCLGEEMLKIKMKIL